MGRVTTVEELRLLPGRFSLCHGVFDVLHEGHLSYFEEAKKLTGKLVVSITSDRYVNKGPGRPFFPEKVRARMVAALDIVDYVVINDEARATNLIKEIEPTFYCKGPDYRDKEKDPTRGIYEEEEAVLRGGGELVIIDKDVYSSSTLINKFFANYTEYQQKTIDTIKNLGGMNTINQLLNDIAKIKVVVVGEPIIDTYVFCTPEGVSSKSPTISARYVGEENYAGGSLAIANHLSDFVSAVHLFAPHGPDEYAKDVFKHSIDSRISFYESRYSKYVTPRKTRFIDHDKGQRVFEFTNIRQDIWTEYSSTLLMDSVVAKTKQSDLTLLCDFGHGLFEDEFIKDLYKIKNKVALNCQTNSSNFGFNPFTKHHRFDYLSLDLKEARVAFHDRTSGSEELFKKINRPNASMTLGAGGAYYKQGSDTVHCPAFSDKVVDATGAGDAYYAMTAALWAIHAPVEMIPFIGNVFAALKTTIIGNKYSVTKAQLVKALTAILK